MARQLRTIAPGECYHITQRGNYKQDIFESFDDYIYYCQCINYYSLKHKATLLAYCLMKNHVHFIITPEHEKSISNLFRTAQMRYTRYKNKESNRTGHLWHSRFYSTHLDQKHLFAAIRYVENNPVRAGIVSSAERYPWSSAKRHCGTEKHVLIAIEEDYCFLSDVGNTPSEWREYLLEEEDNPESLKKNSPGLSKT